MLAEFNFDIFGEFENSCTSEEFNQRLQATGWKYFDLKNLNELFFVKLQSLWKAGDEKLLLKQK